MSANPLHLMSFASKSTENSEPKPATNVVEIKTRSGVIQLHRGTLEIAWPASDFVRVVDVEEFLVGLRAAVVTAEEMICERARQHAAGR